MVWLVGMNHCQRKGTAQTFNGGAHGLVKAVAEAELLFDKVRNDFGVRLGGELKPLGFQFFP